MIQVVNDGGIEQFEKAMPQHHWQRNKKQSLNYVRDSPFAIDRQLEDQRLLMQKNRNPQYLIPTKVDKVRSQVISSTIGASRPVAVKANVINKIVREASGVHNYTIVAPIRRTEEKQTRELLEPETNPRVRPYAQEAKQKPVLCSFGHRPRSASRTFHPATMKFRLKHGEIARGGDNIHKTGFGLPVSVLKQVLNAPKIYRPGEGDFLFGGPLDSEVDDMQVESEDDLNGTDGYPADAPDNYENLFFSEDEHRKMFKPVNQPRTRKSSKSTKQQQQRGAHVDSPVQSVSHDDASSLGKASWVSSIEREAKHTSHKPPQMTYPQLEPLDSGDGRPAWDQAHHCVRLPSNHVFQMRSSGLPTGNKALSLGDRLKRYAALSVAETQPELFCTEKQETDKKIMAGIEHKVPKPTSHLGNPVYFDPNNNELKLIKHYRRQDLEEEKRKQEAREYQKLLKTIPKVDYFPTTKLAEIRSKSSLAYTNSTADNKDSTFEDSFARSSSKNEGFYGGGTGSSSLGLNNTSTGPGDAKFTASMSSWSKYDSSVLEEADGAWQDTERAMKEAMRAARRGDTRALYEYNMKRQNLMAAVEAASDVPMEDI